MDNGPAHRTQNAADWQKGEGGKKKGTAKKNHLQQLFAAAYFASNTFNLFLEGMFLHSKPI